MRKLGLTDKGGLADQFRYKGTPETITWIDAAGRLRVFHCDTRSSNEWEAFYAALWKYGIEAAADACSVSFTKAMKALKATSAFQVRQSW